MRIALAGSLLLGLLCGNPATAADLVVVEAHGVDLTPGQVLDDNKPLVLREGQRVTLLAADGNMVKLRGPYDRAPGGSGGGGDSAAGLTQGLGALLVQKETRTSEVGVVRANVQHVILPEAWVVDAEKPGSACIREGAPLVFWRSATGKQATFTLMPLDRSWKITTPWPVGADRLPMPDTVPVQRRTSFLVELDGTRSAITVNSIPNVVRTNEMRLGWMREKGCEAQAEALLRTLH
jgi:hypothetical protein